MLQSDGVNKVTYVDTGGDEVVFGAVPAV